MSHGNEMTPEDIKYELSNIHRKLVKLTEMTAKIMDHEADRLRNMKWVAWYCQVSEQTIRNWVSNRGFPCVKPDGNKSHLKFRKGEIDVWIENNSINN